MMEGSNAAFMSCWGEDDDGKVEKDKEKSEGWKLAREARVVEEKAKQQSVWEREGCIETNYEVWFWEESVKAR
jgi:hypothetical protein